MGSRASCLPGMVVSVNSAVGGCVRGPESGFGWGLPFGADFVPGEAADFLRMGLPEESVKLPDKIVNKSVIQLKRSPPAEKG